MDPSAAKAMHCIMKKMVSRLSVLPPLACRYPGSNEMKENQKTVYGSPAMIGNIFQRGKGLLYTATIPNKVRQVNNTA